MGNQSKQKIFGILYNVLIALMSLCFLGIVIFDNIDFENTSPPHWVLTSLVCFFLLEKIWSLFKNKKGLAAIGEILKPLGGLFYFITWQITSFSGYFVNLVGITPFLWLLGSIISLSVIVSKPTNDQSLAD